MQQNRVTSGFNPGLFHPFYLIRKGLYTAIKQHAGELNGALLDFGCGTKPYKSFFNTEEYIGVDYDTGLSNSNQQADVFYDGQKLPFLDERFDAVFASEVFEHIFNLEDMLPELHRVMKSNARILITCPFVWNEHEVPHDFARYTQFALKHLLEKHGFNIIKTSKSGNFVTTIFQMTVLYNKEHILPLFGFLMKFPPTRFILKLFFIFIPNVIALIMNAILPTKQDFYQNNIVLAEKK